MRGYVAGHPSRTPAAVRPDPRVVLDAYPDAAVVLSYQMPTYKVGRHSLIVGVWKHGVSFYSWDVGRNGGFAARHP